MPRSTQPSGVGAAAFPYSPFSEGASAAPLNAEAAMRVADVYAAVRVLADAAASLPLVAYRRNGQDRAPYAGPLVGHAGTPEPGDDAGGLHLARGHAPQSPR